VLAPQVSPTEQNRLRVLATTRIDGTEQILRRVDASKLGPDQQQTLGTAQSFLAKAREALAANDYERAFNLADKAQVIATDLARSAR
jgi:hypothetical protein